MRSEKTTHITDELASQPNNQRARSAQCAKDCPQIDCHARQWDSIGLAASLRETRNELLYFIIILITIIITIELAPGNNNDNNNKRNNLVCALQCTAAPRTNTHKHTQLIAVQWARLPARTTD